MDGADVVPQTEKRGRGVGGWRGVAPSSVALMAGRQQWQRVLSNRGSLRGWRRKLSRGRKRGEIRHWIGPAKQKGGMEIVAKETGHSPPTDSFCRRLFVCGPWSGASALSPAPTSCSPFR